MTRKKKSGAPRREPKRVTKKTATSKKRAGRASGGKARTGTKAKPRSGATKTKAASKTKAKPKPKAAASTKPATTAKATAKSKPAKKAPASRPRKSAGENSGAAQARQPSLSPPKHRRRSRVTETLLAHALSLPEAWEDHPWGEVVAKVGKKVFVFFGVSDQFGMAVKLPASATSVLRESYAEPTGYGLGKAGWVTIRLTRPSKAMLDDARRWIEESYLAVAPKTLARRLVEG